MRERVEDQQAVTRDRSVPAVPDGSDGARAPAGSRAAPARDPSHDADVRLVRAFVRNAAVALAFAAAVAVVVGVVHEATPVPLPPLPDDGEDLGGPLGLAVVALAWPALAALGVWAARVGARRRQPDRVLVAVAWIAWVTLAAVVLAGLMLREGFGQGRAIAEPETLEIRAVPVVAPAALVVLAVFGVVWLAARSAAARARVSRVRRRAVAGVLLAPTLVAPFDVLASAPLALLWCVPTTAFALWAVRHLQRHHRMPGWIPLVAVTAALPAYGFVAVVNQIALTHTAVYLPDDVTYAALLSAVSATGEETAKAVAVGMVFAYLWRRLDGVVAGVVVGAAVGLGFNLVESVQYMSPGGEEAGFHLWLRQGVTLLAGHLAFTAIVGGAVGIAFRLRDTAGRALVVAAGLATAISAHAATNYVLITGVHTDLLPGLAPILAALVVVPAVLVLLQAPFVLMYLLVCRAGTRAETASLAEELESLAEWDPVAVNAVEALVLLSPPHRFRMRVDAWRGGGWRASRLVGRLQALQLELAAACARARHHHPDGVGRPDVARARVVRHKARMEVELA